VGQVVPTAGARLVALPPYRGGPGEFVLDRERLVIGRDVGSDLPLTGRGLSRRHAEIVRADGRWLVRDLDSANGTSVAGRPVTGPVLLHDGDVLSLGEVRLLFQGATGPQLGVDETAVRPRIPEPRRGTVDDVVGMLRVQQERESLLREVAATRTKARWFSGVGVALFVVGVVAGVYAVLVTVAQFSAGNGPGVPPPDGNPFGGRLVPLVAVPEAGMLGGALLIVVGVVLHVVATARRRRIDERLTVPVPRPPSFP
jgi:FHA domain